MEIAALRITHETDGETGRRAVGHLVGLSPAAYQVAVRVLGSPEGAQDAVQQAYLKALTHLRSASLPAPTEERTWFLRVVANAAKDQRRKESSLKRREARVEREGAGPSASREDIVAALRVALGSMEEKYRVPVALCYEQGLTQREAAAVLELSEVGISRRIRTGLEKLRKMLERAGYPAAVAAVLGGLKSTAPTVPASLTGKVEALVAKGAAARPASAAKRLAERRRVAKGGIAMKIIAGVVLAGAIAAGVAVIAPGDSRAPLPGPSAGPVKGPPKKDLFAFINQYEYLDGPRLGAMTSRSPKLAWDEKGNMYFFASYWYGAVRCIRTDGRIVPIAGNDYWTLTLPLAEGPASALGNPTGIRGFSFGIPTGCIAVQGTPDEGGEAGSIYVSHMGDGVVRVFRNKAQGNRWWFERIAGGGKGKIPSKRGQSIAAKDVKLGQIGNLQIGLDGKLWVFTGGSFFRYENGKLACLLGPDDYVGQGGPTKGCPQGHIGGDGSFYLGFYYYGGGGGATIWRVSSDGAKREKFAGVAKRSVRDGDIGTEAGWHCGPHFAPGRNHGLYQPADVFFTGSHDEGALRRIKGGRIASLSLDGEWREFVGKASRKKAPIWFQNWQIGPDGASYRTYAGGDWDNDNRMFRITGIDYAKPTAK